MSVARSSSKKSPLKDQSAPVADQATEGSQASRSPVASSSPSKKVADGLPAKIKDIAEEVRDGTATVAKLNTFLKAVAPLVDVEVPAKGVKKVLNNLAQDVLKKAENTAAAPKRSREDDADAQSSPAKAEAMDQFEDEEDVPDFTWTKEDLANFANRKGIDVKGLNKAPMLKKIKKYLDTR